MLRLTALPTAATMNPHIRFRWKTLVESAFANETTALAAWRIDIMKGGVFCTVMLIVVAKVVVEH